jgi:hypothetical protein
MVFEDESWEAPQREQERAGNQSVEDMAIRYIKYLVQVTTPAVCSSENCSLISCEFAALRGFLPLNEREMGTRSRNDGRILPLFSTGQIGSPLFITDKGLKVTSAMTRRIKS